MSHIDFPQNISYRSARKIDKTIGNLKARVPSAFNPLITWRTAVGTDQDDYLEPSTLMAARGPHKGLPTIKVSQTAYPSRGLVMTAVTPLHGLSGKNTTDVAFATAHEMGHIWAKESWRYGCSGPFGILDVLADAFDTDYDGLARLTEEANVPKMQAAFTHYSGSHLDERWKFAERMQHEPPSWVVNGYAFFGPTLFAAEPASLATQQRWDALSDDERWFIRRLSYTYNECFADALAMWATSSDAFGSVAAKNLGDFVFSDLTSLQHLDRRSVVLTHFLDTVELSPADQEVLASFRPDVDAFRKLRLGDHEGATKAHKKAIRTLRVGRIEPDPTRSDPESVIPVFSEIPPDEYSSRHYHHAYISDQGDEAPESTNAVTVRTNPLGSNASYQGRVWHLDFDDDGFLSDVTCWRQDEPSSMEFQPTSHDPVHFERLQAGSSLPTHTAAQVISASYLSNLLVHNALGTRYLPLEISSCLRETLIRTDARHLEIDEHQLLEKVLDAAKAIGAPLDPLWGRFLGVSPIRLHDGDYVAVELHEPTGTKLLGVVAVQVNDQKMPIVNSPDLARLLGTVLVDGLLQPTSDPDVQKTHQGLSKLMVSDALGDETRYSSLVPLAAVGHWISGCTETPIIFRAPDLSVMKAMLSADPTERTRAAWLEASLIDSLQNTIETHYEARLSMALSDLVDLEGFTVHSEVADDRPLTDLTENILETAVVDASARLGAAYMETQSAKATIARLRAVIAKLPATETAFQEVIAQVRAAVPEDRMRCFDEVLPTLAGSLEGMFPEHVPLSYLARDLDVLERYAPKFEDGSRGLRSSTSDPFGTGRWTQDLRPNRQVGTRPVGPEVGVESKEPAVRDTGVEL